MSPWRKLLLSLVLVVSLTPGWGELLENLEHLLHDGHLAHFSQHMETEDGGIDEHAATDEHGCTLLSHNCPCHVSVPAIFTAREGLPTVLLPWTEGVDNPWLERHHSVWANGPPTEPPRA